jgi:hypothetical protein
MISYAIACVFGVLFGLGLFLWSTRFPINPVPPLPGLVRWSFIFFIIALLISGGRLVLQITKTIPWKITPEISVIMSHLLPVSSQADASLGLSAAQPRAISDRPARPPYSRNPADIYRLPGV